MAFILVQCMLLINHGLHTREDVISENVNRRYMYTPLGSYQSHSTILDPPTIPKAAQLLSPNSPCDSLSCFSSSSPWFSSLNADGSQSLRRGKSQSRQRNRGRSLPNLGSQNHQRANQSHQSLQPSTMQSITWYIRKDFEGLDLTWDLGGQQLLLVAPAGGISPGGSPT